MIGRLIKQSLNRIMAPLAMLLLNAGVSPNALTVAGLLPPLAAGWLASQHRLLAAGVVIAVGSWLDLLDGAVARLGDKATPRGAFLDSTLDRVADAALLGGIFWHYISLDRLVGFDRWGPHLVVAALALSLLVPYIKARAQSLGYTCDVGLADRGERTGIVGLGLLLRQTTPALAVLTVVSAISSVQRFVHVWKQGSHAPAPQDQAGRDQGGKADGR